MAAEARGPSLQSIAEATTAWSSAFNRSIKERYALLQRSLEVTGATLSALPKVDYMSLRNAILLIEQHNALLPPWTPQVLKTLSEKHRNQVIEDGCHYMQLSEAAYGWRGALAMGMLGGTDSGASALSGVLGSVMSGDKAAFAHRAGVQVDSILYRSVDSELQEPHHWLVVDHERRELVLTCRGTINVDDAVMDLTATAAPFLRGQAHEGMAAAAHKLHASCFSGDRLNLPGRLESLPGYGLVLTGHSLGGSVAVLLTMLLLHHRHEMEAALPPRHHAHVPLHGVPIRCVAFGMAPVYSSRSPLPPGTHQAITAFVNGDDIVCRLSVRSFNRYMRLAGAVAAAAPTLAESISASMMMKETRSPAEVIQAGLRSATQHPDVEDEPELHIPGHIVFMRGLAKPTPSITDTLTRMSTSAEWVEPMGRSFTAVQERVLGGLSALWTQASPPPTDGDKTAAVSGPAGTPSEDTSGLASPPAAAAPTLQGQAAAEGCTDALRGLGRVTAALLDTPIPTRAQPEPVAATTTLLPDHDTYASVDFRLMHWRELTDMVPLAGTFRVHLPHQYRKVLAALRSAAALRAKGRHSPAAAHDEHSSTEPSEGMESSSTPPTTPPPPRANPYVAGGATTNSAATVPPPRLPPSEDVSQPRTPGGRPDKHAAGRSRERVTIRQGGVQFCRRAGEELPLMGPCSGVVSVAVAGLVHRTPRCTPTPRQAVGGDGEALPGPAREADAAAVPTAPSVLSVPSEVVGVLAGGEKSS